MVLDNEEAVLEAIELDELTELRGAAGPNDSAEKDSADDQYAEDDTAEDDSAEDGFDGSFDYLPKSVRGTTGPSDITWVPPEIEDLEDSYFDGQISREEYFKLREAFFMSDPKRLNVPNSGLQATQPRSRIIRPKSSSLRHMVEAGLQSDEIVELPYCTKGDCSHTVEHWPGKRALMVELNDERTQIFRHNLKEYYLHNIEKILQWLADRDLLSPRHVRKDVDAMIWDDLWVRFCGRGTEMLACFVQMLRMLEEDESLQAIWEGFAQANALGETSVEPLDQDEGKLSLQMMDTGEVKIIRENANFKDEGTELELELQELSPYEVFGALRIWMLYVHAIDLEFHLDMASKCRDLTPKNFANAWHEVEALVNEGKTGHWTESVLLRVSELAHFYERWQPAFKSKQDMATEKDGDEKLESACTGVRDENTSKGHKVQAMQARQKALYSKELGQYNTECCLWAKCLEHMIRAADEEFPEWAKEDEESAAKILNELQKRDLCHEQVKRKQHSTGRGKGVATGKRTADEAGLTESDDAKIEHPRKRRNAMQNLECSAGPEKSNGNETPSERNEDLVGKKPTARRPWGSRPPKRPRPEADDDGNAQVELTTERPPKRVRRNGPVEEADEPTSADTGTRILKRPRGNKKRAREEDDDENDDADADAVAIPPRKIAKAVHHSGPGREVNSQLPPQPQDAGGAIAMQLSRVGDKKRAPKVQVTRSQSDSTEANTSGPSNPPEPGVLSHAPLLQARLNGKTKNSKGKPQHTNKAQPQP